MNDTMRTKRTLQKRKRFLSALAAGCSVTAASKAAAVGRTCLYRWRADDDTFARAWDDAAEQSIDLLEDECRKRAVAGSDLLLIFLLRNRRPHIYRPPRQIGIAGVEGGPPIAVADGRVCVYLPDNRRPPVKSDQ